jgi:hypothetical protein
MKKIFTLIMAVALFNGLKAQDARAVPKGKNSINLYYGYSLIGSLLNTYNTTTSLNYKTSQLGPVGLVYEHMVTDQVGLGAEFGYQQTTASWNYSDSYFNSNFQTVPFTESYTFKYTLMRVQFRFNYHFVKSDKFDAYFLTSAGYRGAQYSLSYSNSDPNAPVTSAAYTTPKSPLFIGIKPGIGIRYFFTNFMGVNLEIAAGTPLMCGGLSFKF